MRKSVFSIFTAAAFTALALTACERERLVGLSEHNTTTRFDVFVEDMSDISDTPATRATLHNTTGDTDKLSEYLTEFQVAAWDGTSGNTAFITAETKVKYFTAGEGGADSYWSAVDGSGNIKEYTWKKSDGSKTFYAYANLPASGASVACTSAAGQTLTITSLPIASENQTDILMGSYQGDGSTTGTASIHFYHPLTAVQFKEGTLSDGVSITGISIKGVYTSGKTTQDATAPSTFAWTKTDDSAFAATDETGTVSLSSVTLDDDSFIGNAIVLIPQTFASDEARIAVTMDTPTGSKTLYYPLKGKNFKAGYTNVFTIGYAPDDFTFELTKSEQATLNLTNTTAKSTEVTIPITSNKNGTSESENWRIQSYQVGSGVPVTVSSTSFTGGGLEVKKSGSNLKITAQPRTSTYGSHDYWVNSMKRTDRLDWSPAAWPGVTDLSRLDFRREIRNVHPMTTANCYIIRHAGTYKFPLVYGNGVIDGTQNNVAFSDEEHKNHLGNGFTSAFIENNEGCTVANCEILWQDEAVVIGTPEIVGATVSAGDYDASNVRYIQFTVNETTICQNNALIAVKDGDGSIIWSWHIWTTNDPALLTDDIPMVNRSFVTYYHFPLYSLGWVDANYAERETVIITLEQTNSGETVTVTVNQPSVAAAGNGTYYQFGRKDPMCRKNTPAQGSFIRNGTAPVTLQVAIQHPDIFYTGTSTNQNWADSPYLHLWLNSQKKTVYDPSPVGYMIPDEGVYNFFIQSGTDTESTELFNTDGDYFNGWNFHTGGWKTGATTFFPASGYRDYSNGAIKDVGVIGHMWTSTCPAGAQGYGWNYSATRIYKKNNFRANGFSVRPVKEQ